MIICHHIKKAFNEQKILDDFSYTFQEHGFYLLFGPSGCGKTTLLNILSGVWDSDAGEVTYQGEKVKEHQDEVAYITQDSYFVDYLDVMDNLRLGCTEDKTILTMMETFGLDQVIHQYPAMLSGGEKQRIAIIRALLLQSRVILLDEPSSALDEENTKKLLELLSELKKEVCIICVSHDASFKSYCDEWIDFLHLEKYSVDQVAEISNKHESIKSKDQRSLYPFIKKQAHYYKENKKISFFLLLLLLSMILLSAMFTNPEDKVISMLGNQTHANVLSVQCDINYIDECFQLQTKEDGIKEVVYVYSAAAEYYEPIVEEVGKSVSIDIPYSDTLSSFTLPKNPHLFALSENIAYGNYAKEKNEVMLGYNLAQKLGFDHLQETIGKELMITTAHGEEIFIITGIYSIIPSDHYTYLESFGKDAHTLNGAYYFTKEYAKDYFYDDQLSINEQEGRVALHLYFDNFDDLWDFEQHQSYPYLRVKSVLTSFSSTIEKIEMITRILFPFLVFLLGIILLFYIFVRIIQMKYTKHLLYVYELCRYSPSQIALAMLRYYLADITKLYLLASVLSIPIGLGVNWLNHEFSILYFSPYLWDTTSIILLYGCVMMLTTVFFFLQFIQLHRHSAYDALRERRDLL